MFSKWLETRDDASWDQLIEAMRTIELNSVASDVEQLLVQGEYVCMYPACLCVCVRACTHVCMQCTLFACTLFLYRIERTKQ